MFVYFTADWCLTCKANEAAAIDRDEVRDAFRKAGVHVLVGDWTNGDPAITRFLESRGRAGVPLYLWYEPGNAEPEELPQILTPAMLIARARPPALAARCQTFLPRDPGFEHLRRGQFGRVTAVGIAVDEDEVGPFARIEAAEPVLGETGIGRAAREAGQRLVEAHPLLGPPSARRLARRILAADRGGEPGEGVGRFDREVRSEGEPRARSARSSARHRRRSSRSGPSRASAIVRSLVWWVGCIEAMIPRGRERAEVGGIEHLDMLDPPAAVALDRSAPSSSIRADHLRVGGIADGVDRDLEPVRRRAAGVLLQLGVADQAAARACRACRHKAP